MHVCVCIEKKVEVVMVYLEHSLKLVGARIKHQKCETKIEERGRNRKITEKKTQQLKIY